MTNKIIQFQYIMETQHNPQFLMVLCEDGTLWEFYDCKWTILGSPPDTNSIPQKNNEPQE